MSKIETRAIFIFHLFPLRGSMHEDLNSKNENFKKRLVGISIFLYSHEIFKFKAAIGTRQKFVLDLKNKNFLQK